VFIKTLEMRKGGENRRGGGKKFFEERCSSKPGHVTGREESHCSQRTHWHSSFNAQS
jgi:hypothetical protein